MTRLNDKPPRGGPLWLACAISASLLLSACSSTPPLACPQLPAWPAHLVPVPMQAISIPSSDSPKPSTPAGKTTSPDGPTRTD